MARAVRPACGHSQALIREHKNSDASRPAPATLYLTNFSADGSTLVGTELLIRANLYAGQKRLFLRRPPGYGANHRVRVS